MGARVAGVTAFGTIADALITIPSPGAIATSTVIIVVVVILVIVVLEILNGLVVVPAILLVSAIAVNHNNGFAVVFPVGRDELNHLIDRDAARAESH